MAKKNRKNASRGSVNNIILEALYSGDKYGYEIISEVESKTDGKVVLKQPSLYSSLTRFEDKGYVTSYWADSEIGGKRHYYKLLEAGRKYFENNVLNKKSDYGWLDNNNDNTTTPIEDNDEIIVNDEEPTNEEYVIDEDDDTDYSSKSYANYTFDVQDKMRSLLEDDNNDEVIDNDEDSYIADNNEVDSNQPIEEDDNTDDGYQTNDEDNYTNSPIIEEELTETDEEELKEQELYNSINNIHQDYSTRQDEIANKDTIKYTNNLKKEMDNVYYSIKSNTKNDSYDEEPDYIREQKKKESLEILYGNNKTEDTKPANKYQFVNSSPNYYQEPQQPVRKTANPYNNQPINSNNTFTGYNTSDFEEILERNKGSRIVKPKQEEVKQDYISEMSDEEREARNKDFVERFDTIADSKLVKSDNTYADDLATMQSMTDVDEDILDVKSDYDNQEAYEAPQPSEKKFVDLDEDEDSYYFPTRQKEEIVPVQETKTTNNITINKFDSNSNTSDSNNYIKINKAKFILGIVLLLLMVVEVSVMLTVFKALDLITRNDNIIFIVAYVICFVIALILMCPFITNPNKRKLNTFRFGFTVSMGLLSFLVLSILSYAINTFIGLDFTNINDFYVKLFVPIILSSNLIWAPMIYKLISKNKQLY